jgi:flagellar hook-basal body complex protein FliE
MPVESLGALSNLTPLPRTKVEQADATSPAASGFTQVLQGVLNQNVESSAEANRAIQAVATGEAQDLHSVSLAVAKADLAFRLILEMRNRLTEAYQEVSRMQV